MASLLFIPSSRNAFKWCISSSERRPCAHQPRAREALALVVARLQPLLHHRVYGKLELACCQVAVAGRGRSFLLYTSTAPDLARPTMR